MKSAGFIAAGLVLTALCAISASPATETTQAEEAKLLPSDGAMLDYFGGSVSISGNTAVVGAPEDDDNGSASGSAYVFVRSDDTWTEEYKLLPEDGAINDEFGWAVAVDADTAIIGAPIDDSKKGSAYVFTRSGDTWTEEDKLLPSDREDIFDFGYAVAIDGDTAAIGAPGTSVGSGITGAAYVFVRTGGVWTEQAKLLPADVGAADLYGYSVSIDGDTAIVGSPTDDDKGTDSGSAYVFVRTGDVWTEQDKLVPSDGAAEDYFGSTVSVFADTAIIGAHFDDDSGANSGSAYVFVRSGDTWSELDKLTPTDSAANQRFGRSVSMIGNTVVIGANGDDVNGNISGSAYVFSRHGDTWTEQVKFVPTDGAAIDHFGRAVSLSEGMALIGAPTDDDNGMDSGSAYVFSIGTIFADGFESGDCSNWTRQVPPP